MRRALLLALCLALLFSLAFIAPASAQPKFPCNGQFDRLLKGFYVNHTDMEGFFNDAAALDACRRSLDAHNPEHRLVAAYIRINRPGRSTDDYQAALADMARLCAAASKPACYYALIYENIDLEMRATRLPPLVEAGLPAAKTMLALLLAAGPEVGLVQDMKTADRLAREASGAGDYWASFLLARNLAAEMPADLATLDGRWILRAADQGHVGARVVHADAMLRRGYLVMAEGALLAAAHADPHTFKADIAAARYALGVIYRDRAAHDAASGATPLPGPSFAAQSRQWFEAAAELGHPGAKQALEKMK